MRSVVASVVLLGAGSCASISMNTQESSLVLSLSEEQTSLRAASDSFAALATDRGWVETRSGLTLLHSLLSEAAAPSDVKTYANRIQSEAVSPSNITSRVTSDTQMAKDGLSVVLAEAKQLKSSNAEITREDVASFERSLVFAQSARRSFAEAIDTVAPKIAAAELRTADSWLQSFDGVIDEASALADDLAETAFRDEVAISS